MTNETERQEPFITLAQSKVAAGLFRPVGVDAAGRVNNLPVHTHRNTIQTMAAACKLYGMKYNIPVLFHKHIATLPIPAHVEAEINALVLAEVNEVLNG